MPAFLRAVRGAYWCQAIFKCRQGVLIMSSGFVAGTGAYRRANWALFCAGFSTFSLMYCAQPLLPLFADYFRVSRAQSSLALSMTTGMLALSIIVVGVNAQRLPRKPL